MRLSFLPLIALAAVSRAQTAQEYLHLRHQYKISQAVSQRALESLVGGKICELDGIVKGTYRVGVCPMIQLERPDGTSLAVEADSVPDWIQGSEVQVRLIVRAQRELEGGPLVCHLLGASTEEVVARDVPPPAPPVKQKQSAQQPVRSVSRLNELELLSRGTSRTRHWTATEREALPSYARYVKAQNHKLSNSEAIRIAAGIIAFSDHYGVDPRLIIAIISVESDFDPGSTSNHGAMGLGQLMPSTAEWMGVHNAYDSIQSVYGCVKLMRTHIDQYFKQTGRSDDAQILALAAYNAGAGAVKRHGGNIPPYRETQAYVRRVWMKYLQLKGIR